MTSPSPLGEGWGEGNGTIPPIDPATLTIARPDDWHLHLRDGEALEAVLPHTARRFGRAIVMPNLKPPVTTGEQAVAYRERIQAGRARRRRLQAVHDALPHRQPAGGRDRAREGCRRRRAASSTPPAPPPTATRASPTSREPRDAGEAMQREGLPLLVHGEVTYPEVDVFDREAVFIETQLIPLRRDLPELEIVVEHITTKDAADYVRDADRFVAATITAHHLLPTATRSSWAVSGRTITACRCSSGRSTAWRWWKRRPAATPTSSWAPTAPRTRPT